MHLFIHREILFSGKGGNTECIDETAKKNRAFIFFSL